MDPTDLPAYPNPPPEQRVRALLCGDETGQLQVVAPEQALVDPEPILACTARKVRRLPHAEETAICAIPGYYGLPSVVDSGLKTKPTLALATEQPGHYVKVSGKQVQQMCLSHASFDTEFCRNLTPTPVDPADDEQHILQAVDTFTRRRIQARLDETLHIPPLPEAAQRIIALQQDPNYDLSDLVKIVETDPAIAARIMGWANSAFYASHAQARDLNDAIMRVLGFDMVFNMALGMAIGASLNLPKSHVSGASPYWLDAVYTAATMEALAHQFAPPAPLNPATAYLAGLLANFGTLVIGHVFPPQYETICQIEEANPQLPHIYADQHVLGVNREVIAARLLAQWELPGDIVHCIRYQYAPIQAQDEPGYTQLLKLTHQLLAQLAGADQACVPEALSTQATCLGLRPGGLEEVAEVLSGSREELIELAQTIAPAG